MASQSEWRQTIAMLLSLTIFFLWLIRAAAEIVFFRLGPEGVLWRVILFLVLSILYFIPAIRRDTLVKTAR